MNERISTPPRTFDAFFKSPDQNETVDNLYCLSVELEDALRGLIDAIEPCENDHLPEYKHALNILSDNH